MHDKKWTGLPALAIVLLLVLGVATVSVLLVRFLGWLPEYARDLLMTVSILIPLFKSMAKAEA